MASLKTIDIVCWIVCTNTPELTVQTGVVCFSRFKVHGAHTVAQCEITGYAHLAGTERVLGNFMTRGADAAVAPRGRKCEMG